MLEADSLYGNLLGETPDVAPKPVGDDIFAVWKKKKDAQRVQEHEELEVEDEDADGEAPQYLDDEEVEDEDPDEEDGEAPRYLDDDEADFEQWPMSRKLFWVKRRRARMHYLARDVESHKEELAVEDLFACLFAVWASLLIF
eukprot:gb/GFBE01037151.1/.p1 GENE.gb/GFBE01037151.1/~~gb/GFBE01037151.1/.p1  ORF type:complete len:142 (+),score=40.33 gb/GFBE01037151.1/:1-426(+)